MSDQFPGWYYGPNGESQIFNSIEEVPEGWEDHPRKVKAPKVGKGGQEDGKKESKPAPKEPAKAPKTKEEVVAGITPPESVGDSPDPVVVPEGTVGEEGVSDEQDKPMTKEEMTVSLMTKDMSELWGMAKELKIGKDGKKPELVARIVEQLIAEQANETATVL